MGEFVSLTLMVHSFALLERAGVHHQSPRLYCVCVAKSTQAKKHALKTTDTS
jgi:hypothetical protein